MSDAASSLISGAFGLAGAGINYASQQSANETNLQVARENRDFMYQQWMRENAYNDPSAVMQRLARAGLNPNLMYGEGAGGLAASASMPAVDPGRVVAPQVDPLLLAQIGNIKADTQLKEAQAGNQGAQADLARNQIKVGDSVIMYNKALSSMTDSQRKNIEAQTEFLGKQTEVANSQIALNYANVQNMTLQQQQRWAELSIRSKEVEAVCQKYAAETKMTNEQIKYVGLLAMAKVYNLRADTALKKAQEGLTNKQISECEQAIENMKVQHGQMSWQLQMDQKYEESERSIKIRQAAADIVSEMMNASRLKGGSFDGPIDAWYEEGMADVNRLSR